MAFLSDSQRNTLRAICDTFAPPLNASGSEDPRLFSVSAGELGLAGALETALERASDPATRAQLRLFFFLLDMSVVNGIAAGVWRPFSAATLESRTAILQAWALSPLGFARRAFNGVKRLSLFLFYSLPGPETGTGNPVWRSLGYEIPASRERSGASAGKDRAGADSDHTGNDEPGRAVGTIKPFDTYPDQILDTDILVIGSGAGGGIVAGELAAAGYEVIVAEKGECFADREFPRRELEANERMYEKYGALTTADSAIAVLAGSTLGGGTVINWTGSLRTPDYVMDEWERQYGFEGVSGKELQDSFDAVSKRMHVGTEESVPNGNAIAFERGCKVLGHKVAIIPRNVKDCGECGFCTFGCSRGAKQSTLKTYLQDAHDLGTRILAGARAERVTYTQGTVTGAELTVRTPGGTEYPIKVRARAVVVAAGSVHTPALLLRSGLNNPNIGAGLRLHPTTFSTAVFADPVLPWQGAPMTRIATGLDNLDGRGYGVRLMTAPAHPGISGFAAPWLSGRQHRRNMQDLRNTANIIVITRDYHGGRVTLDKRGEPVLRYTLHPGDARHMMRGLVEALKIHRAAGALRLSSPQNQGHVYLADGNAGFDDFLRRVQNTGLQSNGFTVFSAHQMSSCRIAGNPKSGVFDSGAQSYEVKNLFAADGSVLPTCSGVNPMLSILGVTHMLAGRIKARLGHPR